MPLRNATFLHWGHTVPNGQPMTHEPSQLTSFFFLPPVLEAQGFERLTLATDRVDFLMLVPITEAERAYAIEHGAAALGQLMEDTALHFTVDEKRFSLLGKAATCRAGSGPRPAPAFQPGAARARSAIRTLPACAFAWINASCTAASATPAEVRDSPSPTGAPPSRCAGGRAAVHAASAGGRLAAGICRCRRQRTTPQAMLEHISMPRYLPKFATQLSGRMSQRSPKSRSITPVIQTAINREASQTRHVRHITAR